MSGENDDVGEKESMHISLARFMRPTLSITVQKCHVASAYSFCQPMGDI